MKILFLDDEIDRVNIFRKNNPEVSVCHVTNFSDFLDAVKEDNFDLFMLDHDLGSDVYTGTSAAAYLAFNKPIIGDGKNVIIHSANPIGATNMMSQFKHTDHINVYVVAFGWTKVFIENDTINIKNI